MRKTLFRQLITYMLVFLFVIGAVSFLVLEFYFDDYYYSREKKSLIEKTEYLAEIYEKEDLTSFLESMEAYMLEQGMSALMLDIENNRIYGSSVQGYGRMGIGNIFKREPGGDVFVSSVSGHTGASADWLSYLLETDDGNLILGRVSYSSIDSVVSSVMDFALVFGIVLAVLFVIFAYFFSKSMSQPLKKLNRIASKMGELDFSMKYEGSREDEIGLLGKTLNSLTSKLENTITQLKGELEKERSLEKMRTVFTARVSHELQTPLSVIKGYAEALSDGIYSSEESPDVYSVLLSETEKISNMVDDLLDLSQIEADVYVLRKSDFSLAGMLDKIVERHKTAFEDGNFTISYSRSHNGELQYFGDPLRLEQAVRNILNNAIKHVNPGGEIFVELKTENGRPVILISNEGDPIPEEDLPHIFESFYQGSNKKSGAGLGLSITKHIISLHGGSISASNGNNGVTVKISLP